MPWCAAPRPRPDARSGVLMRSTKQEHCMGTSGLFLLLAEFLWLGAFRCWFVVVFGRPPLLAGLNCWLAPGSGEVLVRKGRGIQELVPRRWRGCGEVAAI